MDKKELLDFADFYLSFKNINNDDARVNNNVNLTNDFVNFVLDVNSLSKQENSTEKLLQFVKNKFSSILCKQEIEGKMHEMVSTISEKPKFFIEKISNYNLVNKYQSLEEINNFIDSLSVKEFDGKNR